MEDYSRITESVDISLLKKSKIIVIGAGGSYSLVLALARTGIGNLIVFDFDTVDTSNLVRQGYTIKDVGKHKVVALEKAVKEINPLVNFQGITKNFLDMSESEIENHFKNADLILSLTDSFKAQSGINIIALRFNIPTIWSGWYAKSRTAELFFQIPNYTKSCFRCCMSSRYIANEKEEIKVSSNCNTIFHSQLLDGFIGFIALAILHRNNQVNDFGELLEFASFFNELKNKNGFIDYNFFQFKAHPLGGNQLFDKAYLDLGMKSQNFVPYWQKIDAEIPENGYKICPDCKGKLNNTIIKN
jgi:molybdopterin/thiamine biosynthesis adenylyltransferase